MKWQLKMWRQKNPMHVLSGVGEERAADCGIGVFADDVLKKHYVREATAEAAIGLIRDSASDLDAELARGRYKQNGKKRVLIPSLGKTRENRKLTTLLGKDEGAQEHHARYLGGIHSSNDANCHEIKIRLRSMAIGWKVWAGSGSWVGSSD